MSASSSGQRDMQASRFPPGQLLFGSLVVAGSVGFGPAVVPSVGAAVGGSVGGTVVESDQMIFYEKIMSISTKCLVLFLQRLTHGVVEKSSHCHLEA